MSEISTGYIECPKCKLGTITVTSNYITQEVIYSKCSNCKKKTIKKEKIDNYNK